MKKRKLINNEVRRNNHTERKSDPFYYSKRWVKLRGVERKRHPTCAYCRPKVTPTQLIDHVRPRRLYPELEYDTNNLIGSCHRCHNRKSARESRISTRDEFESNMTGYIQICEQEHKTK